MVGVIENPLSSRLRRPKISIMVSDKALLALATSAAGLGVIGLLSLPGGVSLATQLRGRQPKSESEVYEDQDGKSTLQAVEAFSNKVPKAFVLLLSIIGLGLSVALAVLTALNAEGPLNGFLVQNGLGIGAWVSKTRNP